MQEAYFYVDGEYIGMATNDGLTTPEWFAVECGLEVDILSRQGMEASFVIIEV